MSYDSGLKAKCVLPTAIVVPASLIPGVATTDTSVQVQVRQRLSGVEALA